jgi:hypothetical protein
MEIMQVVLRQIAACVVILCAAGCATPPPPPTPEKDIVIVGGVRVDPVQRTVMVTGFVNQVGGPIELFACGTGGKRHESIFVLEADPVDLQSALLLLGLKAGPPMQGLGMGPPEGSAVSMTVEWQRKGRTRRARAEAFIIEYATEKPLVDPGWVYTGSTFEDGRFMAKVEESYIATYWDPWAIINIASELGDDDEALWVNERLVPPLGTPIVLYITPRH